MAIEYAKAAQNDILMSISVTNRGPEAAACYVLPTLWYRNTWSWGYAAGPLGEVPHKPRMAQVSATAVQADHPAQGRFYFYAENPDALLFTENETNRESGAPRKADSPFYRPPPGCPSIAFRKMSCRESRL